MNLWMVYICNAIGRALESTINMKRWETGEWTLHCLPKSSEICDCIRPF